MRIKKKIDKKKGIFFRISGLPGSGKTRLAIKLLPMIKKEFGPTIMWSGDDMRRIFKNRKYDLKSRNEFGEMNVKLASFILNQKSNVIFATVGLDNEIRKFTKKNISNYVEIFIDSKIKTLKKRKVRKFYANKNNAKNVWGYDIKPQIPKKPDIKIFNNFKFNIDFLSNKIFKKIIEII
jgi:adenylylsulfate kinase-like enzyme